MVNSSRAHFLKREIFFDLSLVIGGGGAFACICRPYKLEDGGRAGIARRESEERERDRDRWG